MSYTRKMKMAEIPEAVQAFSDSGFDPVSMSSLMDLLQEQTQYVQDRFWSLSDAEYARIVKEQQSKAPKAS